AAREGSAALSERHAADADVAAAAGRPGADRAGDRAAGLASRDARAEAAVASRAFSRAVEASPPHDPGVRSTTLLDGGLSRESGKNLWWCSGRATIFFGVAMIMSPRTWIAALAVVAAAATPTRVYADARNEVRAVTFDEDGG